MVCLDRMAAAMAVGATAPAAGLAVVVQAVEEVGARVAGLAVVAAAVGRVEAQADLAESVRRRRAWRRIERSCKK